MSMDRLLCNVYVVNLINELNLGVSDSIKHCLHAIQLLLSSGSYDATLGYDWRSGCCRLNLLSR